jgi:CRISPR-associated endonuclease/helicase Cas3
MSPLAHSAPKAGLPAQPYGEHANNCRALAAIHAAGVSKFASPTSGWQSWVQPISTGGEWHDLGKLDTDNQKALEQGRGTRLPVDHVDAGVAAALQPENQDEAAAWLIRSHHSPGLPSLVTENTRLSFRLRGKRDARDDDAFHRDLVERNNLQLAALVEQHLDSLGQASVGFSKSSPSHGIAARLALSCIVDSDHSDAGRFDRNGKGEPDFPEEYDPKWSERLEALKSYIGKKQAEGKGDAERNRIRQCFFDACLDYPIVNNNLVSCEASVGLGKTTSVLAYLLRQAKEKNLRRIILVAPFTNIIRQTAQTLQKALLLLGEKAEDVILQHHHRADFSSEEFRDLAVTWDVPIILTTAVQFFETLGSNNPTALRKLHRLPGSAIFIDEAHAALPFDLWPQCFEWLRELSQVWSCPTALVSGSQVRFWEEPWGRPVKKSTLTLNDITPTEVAAFSNHQELLRCQLRKHPSPLNAAELGELIKANLAKGRNQLVILNTVHSAAGFARKMSESLCQAANLDISESRVLHLSTLLTPAHRERILQEIERRNEENRENFTWVLIATSCVEAGVDLDFHDGFREDASMSSLIQTSGRINRHGLFVDSVLTRITLATDPLFKPHPYFKLSARILDKLFHFLEAGEETLSDIATAAVADEINDDKKSPRLAAISRAESEHNYPEVEKLCKVIQSDTATILVDKDLAADLRNGVPVKRRNLMDQSVQLWAANIENLGLEALTSKSGQVELFVASDASYDKQLLGLGKAILDSSMSGKGFCAI